MQPFDEYLDEQEQLDEGIIRSGTVATFAARSAADGKKVENACKKGLSVLSSPSDRDDTAERLDRINAALKAILDGLLHQQRQIGNHVALNTIGHTASQSKKRR
jgi:hypothetical protein